MNTEFLSGSISSTCPDSNAPAMEIKTVTYLKCINCPDLGRKCTGPNLSPLQTINNARDYHRNLRAIRKIPMKAIFERTEKYVSNATVKDYFSHEVRDFLWTTVALIDTALTAICGGTYEIDTTDSPCPATSSEITTILAGEKGMREAAENRCADLESQLLSAHADNSVLAERTRAESRDTIDDLRTQLAEAKLERKEYKAASERKSRMIAALGVATGLLAILSTVVLVLYFG